MGTSIAVWAALMAALPAIADSLPDAATLLRQKGAISEHGSYRMESKIDMEMSLGADAPMRMEVESTVSAIPPDRLRSEARTPVGSALIVSDGNATYTYISSLNQYTKSPAVASQQFLLEQAGIRGLPDETDLLKKARTLREEAIESDGVKHPCWVVELRIDKYDLPQAMGGTLSGAVMTVWMDKQLGVMRRMTMSGKLQSAQTPGGAEFRQSMNIYGIELDPPLPDDLFSFAPPAGAREVPYFGGQLPRSALVGKAAPPFSTKTMDGADLDLAKLKGKVVLLDFWTTWCAPCRGEFNDLAKIADDFGKDIVVVAVNAGENRAAVEAFLKSRPLSYPAAILDAQAISAYEVTAYPTHILIGRDGMVLDRQLGTGTAELRELLGKAGLKTPQPESAK